MDRGVEPVHRGQDGGRGQRRSCSLDEKGGRKGSTREEREQVKGRTREEEEEEKI